MDTRNDMHRIMRNVVTRHHGVVELHMACFLESPVFMHCAGAAILFLAVRWQPEASGLNFVFAHGSMSDD
jgi:hypothetical protein